MDGWMDEWIGRKIHIDDLEKWNSFESMAMLGI